MDEVLPMTLHESIEIFSIILGVVLQVFIVKWWSILPLIAAAPVYWKIRQLYVPISYGIKRLEGAGRLSLSLLDTAHRSSNSDDLSFTQPKAPCSRTPYPRSRAW